jgi:DnaJ homolog subfamily B member 4
MLFGGRGGDLGAHYSGSHRHRRNHERVANVPCTMEELYRGKVKKMKVTRKSLKEGRTTEKILELPIKPGFKAGTLIKFSDEGDEIETGLAEDLVFFIRELKHERFVRGDDLHYEILVQMADVLCWFSRDFLMLDEKPRIKDLNQMRPCQIFLPK